MKLGVLMVSFGEPETPTREQVVPFLERIFLTNASLEGQQPDEAQRARSRQLAQARAPALLETYKEIGGSPLNLQARAHANALEAELVRRGVAARCYTVFQFVEPSIVAGLEQALADGCERLVALPVYPLCGQSTTVAALDEVARSLRSLESDTEVLEIAGWHRHPDYLPMHADHVAAFCRRVGVDLRDDDTKLLFSVHGTPLRYLYGGSRYDRYVEEACAGIAAGLGVERYSIGFQNHSNRPIEWTEPAMEKVVERLEGRAVVMVAPSFMHEQSETLAELDRDVRALVEARGLVFHRVPIPHDEPRFATLLADLVESRASGESTGRVEWRRCVCRGRSGARCTNGMRLDTLDVRGAGEASRA
jgi:protoporphyrin/coproporphyrin ferrochelatase